MAGYTSLNRQNANKKSCLPNSTVLAKIAMGVIIVSFVLAIVGTFTNNWQESQVGETKVTSGLMNICSPSCEGMAALQAAYKDTDFEKTHFTVLIIQMIGFVLIMVSMILVIIHVVKGNKILAIGSMALALLAGGCLASAVAMYFMSRESFIDSKISWSLFMDAGSAALALTGGIMLLINGCITA